MIWRISLITFLGYYVKQAMKILSPFYLSTLCQNNQHFLVPEKKMLINRMHFIATKKLSTFDLLLIAYEITRRCEIFILSKCSWTTFVQMAWTMLYERAKKIERKIITTTKSTWSRRLMFLSSHDKGAAPRKKQLCARNVCHQFPF